MLDEFGSHIPAYLRTDPKDGLLLVSHQEPNDTHRTRMRNLIRKGHLFTCLETGS